MLLQVLLIASIGEGLPHSSITNDTTLASTRTPPIRPAPTYLDSSFSESSCSSKTIKKERRKTREMIQDDYRLRPHKCGGPGWTRVYYLNLKEDTRSSCPANLTQLYRFDKLIDGTPTVCGHKSKVHGTCDSVEIPVHSIQYSTVCGRIHGYQVGGCNAFYNSIHGNATINDAYVAGLSLTHGGPNHRRHIWTFACAIDYKKEKKIKDYFATLCPCLVPANFLTFELPPFIAKAMEAPSFIGNDYFCDAESFIYKDTSSPSYPDPSYLDPLWDGDGCENTSTCCTFNQPPWFYKELNYTTSDNLELRLCPLSSTSRNNPILVIYHVELYVR